ncbi:MAG: alpha/beta hydrolase [Rhodospirillaceae bacterium]
MAERAHHSLSTGTATIAFHRSEGRGPGIIFCGGFQSDMTGTKALALEAAARAAGRAFVRFDYQGHGASSGSFTDGTIGQWAEDARQVLDKATEGPQILVGSSMGAWIMLLLALSRPERVAGMVGIASAPDFTEDLIWGTLNPEQRITLLDTGKIALGSDYSADSDPITLALIDEARRHLVLRGPLPFTGPVRLLHGMCDVDVPWVTSVRLVERLSSPDVRLTLIKDGDHRLSRDQDLALICRTVEKMAARLNSCRCT